MDNNYRILVVDDEQDLCEILKFNLETDGYVVETANSAEEALKMNIESFDLLLLDVMMGGMSGFAMAKKLKSEPATKDIPVIFLTARDTENDTVTGFNLGADDYISKPFSIREVLVRIRAVLRRTAEKEGAQQSNVLRYQGLELNLDKKTVSIDGEDVPFTKTEDMAERRARARPHRGRKHNAPEKKDRQVLEVHCHTTRIRLLFRCITVSRRRGKVTKRV